MNKFEQAAIILAHTQRNKDVNTLYKRRGCTKRSQAKDKASSVEDMFIGCINRPWTAPTTKRRIRTWRPRRDKQQ